MRCEVARLFKVLPVDLLRLPTSEFRMMIRYYRLIRKQMEDAGGGDGPGPNDTVVE